jgi:hypothetical protein
MDLPDKKEKLAGFLYGGLPLPDMEMEADNDLVEDADEGKEQPSQHQPQPQSQPDHQLQPSGGNRCPSRQVLQQRLRQVILAKIVPEFETVSVMDQLCLVPDWRRKLRRDLQRLVDAHGLKRVGDKPGEANLYFECNEDPALVLHGTEVLGLIIRLGANASRQAGQRLLRHGELADGRELVLYAVKILLYPGAPSITVQADAAGGIIYHRDRVAFALRTVLALGFEDEDNLGGEPRRLPAFKARPAFIPPELSDLPESETHMRVELKEGDCQVGTRDGLCDGYAWGPHAATAATAQGLSHSSVRIILDFGVSKSASLSLESPNGMFPASAYDGRNQPSPEDPEFPIPKDWLKDGRLQTHLTHHHRQMSKSLV